MTLSLPLLYVLWLEEYWQISPNKNKSPNLWHVTSILVCCIFVLAHSRRIVSKTDALQGNAYTKTSWLWCLQLSKLQKIIKSSASGCVSSSLACCHTCSASIHNRATGHATTLARPRPGHYSAWMGFIWYHSGHKTPNWKVSKIQIIRSVVWAQQIWICSIQ